MSTGCTTVKALQVDWSESVTKMLLKSSHESMMTRGSKDGHEKEMLRVEEDLSRHHKKRTWEGYHGSYFQRFER